MNSLVKIKYCIIAFFLSLMACNQGQQGREERIKPGKAEMTELNRYLVQKDRERISSYIERKDLVMTESPTGLWFLIKDEGLGDLLKDFDRIVFEYDCSLLDGTPVYSSKELGPKEIILGRSELEPGLYQGFRMLKPGAEAVFILPPFLAFGLKGDGKKIPSRAVIVYNIHILRGL